MNLYREITLAEVEEQITKSKETVAHFMQDRSDSFLAQYNGGNYGSAFVIAGNEMPYGYSHLLTRLMKYHEAKEMVNRGEKIYTKMLSTDLS